LGELIAVLAAGGFALASFYLRMGQRERPHDDGVLNLAPVSRVSLINASQPVLAVILGVIFFRQHDHITWRVAASAGCIVAGVCLVLLR